MALLQRWTFTDHALSRLKSMAVGSTIILPPSQFKGAVPKDATLVTPMLDRRQWTIKPDGLALIATRLH